MTDQEFHELELRVAQLQQERDTLRSERDNFAEQAADWQRMAHEQEQRVIALTAALRFYGQHSAECWKAKPGECICGFDAALDATKTP